MKNFITEFKQFISRGNVVDMAVGVVVGSAFTAIVNSLVKDMITPLIGLLFGGIDFSDMKLVFRAATEETAELALTYGNFLQAIVNFLLVSFAIFSVVKAMNSFRRKKEEESAPEPEPEPESEPEPSEEVLLLREIRNSLKK